MISPAAAAKPFLKPVGLSPLQCLELMSWPQDRVDYWEERAAIAAQDGAMPRADAERQAFEECKP